MSEPLIYRSPGVGIRLVTKLRRTAYAVAAVYALIAVGFTALGGFAVLAGFLLFFAMWGLPVWAHYQRIVEPSTQTSAGPLLAGSLHVDGSQILVLSATGTLRADRADVADGWVEPFGSGGHRVVLRLRSGDLGIVEVESHARGQALLSSLGLSADQQALRVRTAGNPDQVLREMGLVFGLLVLTIPLFVLGFADETTTLLVSAAVAASIAAFTGLLARATVKPVVRVGLDGVEWSRGRHRRFFPVRDIVAVHLSVVGVEIEVARQSGPAELVTLRCWGVQQAALHGRIQEVRRGFGATAASAAQLAQLDRHGRPLDAWRDALRRVASDDAGDYRRIGLGREDLARVLAQGDQPPERRIGAALALAASGDPNERQRVRIAAQACANDELRAALDRIAEDEADDALVDAAIHGARRESAAG